MMLVSFLLGMVAGYMVLPMLMNLIVKIKSKFVKQQPPEIKQP